MAKTKETKNAKGNKLAKTKAGKTPKASTAKKAGELTRQHILGIGKSLDTAWNSWTAAVFSEHALEKIAETKSLALGLIALILVDIVLIFPTDAASLTGYAIWRNFTIVFFLLFFAAAVSFTFSRLLGSKTQFKSFLPGIMSTVFLSLLLVTIPVALIAYAIFKSIFSSNTALTLFFSVIPFYNYLVFGWSAETLSGLKGVRSIIAALVSLFSILLLNMLLPYVII
jgi:hypothetical protein